MRSRIKENFSEAEMEFIKGICYSQYFPDNNAKANAFLYKFGNKGFVELAPATNRYAMLKGDYVFKFAMDRDGFEDNMNEFRLSKELQPYVTKTYETNGYILVAEYVNLIDEATFIRSKENISSILECISEEYIFADVGIISKNFCNWGFRDDGTLVILDYGYFKKRDNMIMHCQRCGGELVYDTNYDQLYCRMCTRKYNPLEIMYNMELSQEDFDSVEKIEGAYKVRICGRR